MTSHPEDIAAIALLDEPIRRALYEWVVAAGRPVGRDECALAVGVSRALAAFHLDRLVEADLLVPEYRRLSGRTGPGAGRPAKLYRRGPREVSITLPARRYDVAARLLARSIEAMDDERAPATLRATAHDAGAAIGVDARRRAGSRAGRAQRRGSLEATLAEGGYEPRTTDAGEIQFGNCPFDALVEDHRDLVCGMNLAMADGILDGLRGDDFVARSDPAPGRCCVVLTPVPS